MFIFFFSSRRRHTRCALVTGVQTCALPIFTALKNPDGTVRGFAIVVRDITDQRAAESALRNRESHLRSILSTVPDAMIVIDERGKMLSFSAAAERLLGYTQEIGRASCRERVCQYV